MRLVIHLLLIVLLDLVLQLLVFLLDAFALSRDRVQLLAEVDEASTLLVELDAQRLYLLEALLVRRQLIDHRTLQVLYLTLK